MKALIFGSLYLATKEDDFLSLWLQQVKRCTKGIDYNWLLIDSCSPVLPDGLAPYYLKYDATDCFDHDLPGHGSGIISFADNPGHLKNGGKDGGMRAISQGIKIAADHGYDYAVHVESDLLIRVDINSILDRMHRQGYQFLVPLAKPYQFIETGLMFMSVPFMRDIRFIETYNWKEVASPTLPEKRVSAIIGSHTVIAGSINGIRAEGRALGKKEVDRLHYLTHAARQDMELFSTLDIVDIYR